MVILRAFKIFALEYGAMKAKLFAPTSFEVPRSLKKQTQVFGMGKKNAELLVKYLNTLPLESTPLIIYGCAGSLTPNYKAGDTFIISKIIYDSFTHITLEDGPHVLRTASLITAPSIVATPEEKKMLALQTNADLVDLEMFHIWTHASLEIRKRLIFVRTVIDEHHDDLEFLVKKSAWLKISTWPKAFRFLKRFRIYLRSIEKFLSGPEFQKKIYE